MNENIYKNQKDIVEKFYSVYYRTPRINEFIKCGGNIEEIRNEYHNYREFLEYIGYPWSSKSETIEVLDKNQNVIFTGIIADIADEFDVTRIDVNKCLKSNMRLKSKYYLREKLFDLNSL